MAAMNLAAAWLWQRLTGSDDQDGLPECHRWGDR